MSLVNLVRQFKEKYNFTQPDIRQFKELEGLNLTQLIVRLYSDFSDKGIHRSFGDNLKHGMFYAAGEELKKLPFEITGAINAFLGLFGPIPELNNYNRPIYRDGNLESIATNAGLYANIKSNGKQKDANELPLEVTCDLKQYREWHILYTYAEAMEFAEELSKIGRNDLADRMVRELDSYADPNVDYHMSDLNNLLLEIGHEIREYIDENDWKTLMTLANIQESEDAFKHTFTKKTTRPIENRMKRNGVDNAYSEGFTDSVRSYLRSFSGKHPWRYVAIAGAVIGLGAAIAVGYGTRQAIFSYLQRQDKNREYAVAELLPEASNELSGALPYSISVGNLAANSDRGYLYMFGENEDARKIQFNILTGLVSEGIDENTQRSSELQIYYNDPQLSEAIRLVREGANMVDSAVWQSYISHTRPVCETKTDSNGNTYQDCHDECYARTFYLHKDQAQVTEGIRIMQSGLDTTVFAVPFRTMAWPYIDPNAFPNANNDIVKGYNLAGEGSGYVTANISTWSGIFTQYNDFDTVYDFGCYRYSVPWVPDDLASSISFQSGKLANVSDISSMMSEVDEITLRYKGLFRAADGREETAQLLGDYSIELHRAIGLPGGGHLFQSEINMISWISGLIAAGAIGVGAYLLLNEALDAMYARKINELWETS